MLCQVPKKEALALAACGGMGWTARWELCLDAFFRWLEWYADTPSVEQSFAWANYVDDGV